MALTSSPGRIDLTTDTSSGVTAANILTFRTQITGAQTDFALVSVATGARIALTRLIVKAHAANSVNVTVLIGFGLTTTPTAAGVVLADGGMAPGSGIGEGGGSGLLGVGADAEDLRVTCSAPTGGNLEIFGSYYPF